MPYTIGNVTKQSRRCNMKRYNRILSIALSLTMLCATLPTKVLASGLEEARLKNAEEHYEQNLKKEGKILSEVIEKRQLNVKHFLKDDFTYEAAIYSSPVHYLENGKLKDIDNTFIESKDENNNDILENKENDFKVRVAKNAKASKLVNIKKDKYELSWNIVRNTNDVQTRVKEKDFDSFNSLTENEKKKSLPNISSTVEFENIFENTDLQYQVDSNKLKENIVLKSKIENPSFQFNVNIKNLAARLHNNIITFYDEKDSAKEIFTIEAPFMYDAKNSHSEDITLELKQENSGYTVTLTPNADWLNDPSREFPVTIDPLVTTSKDVNSINDSTIASSLPNQNNQTSILLGVGKGSVSGTSRSFMKFSLPALTSAETVVGATLWLSLYTGNSTIRQINAHQVTGNWNSSDITWANAPSYNTNIEDYTNVSGASGSWADWDITKVVKQWYNTGQNLGVMLKANDESTGYNDFYSSDNSASYAIARPQVEIQYVSNLGLESYWTYHSQSVGRAGVGYVNDFNGNLIFIHDDLSMNGNRMPVSISHVYNNNEKGPWDRTRPWFGRGWNLNIYQRVDRKQINSDWYWVYTDEDGTKHYFLDNGSTTLSDELNLGYTFIKDASGKYFIKDKLDNKIKFYSDGSLDMFIDNNGNTITAQYKQAPNNGIWLISGLVDGAGRTTTINYDNNGLILSIVDPAGRTTRFVFDQTNYETIKQIIYPDNKISEFSYDAFYNLKSVKNIDGFQINYEYTTTLPHRVKKVYERNGTTDGNELTINYGNNKTDFTDVEGRKETFIFNYFGKTTSIKDAEDNAEYFEYSDDNNKTKIGQASKLQKTIKNYLQNHNAELNSVWYANTTGLSYTTEDKHLGSQALKILSDTDQGWKYYAQNVTLKKGNTYTLSGYIKTKDVTAGDNRGAAVVASYKDINGNWQYFRKFVTGTNDWNRYEVSFKLPSDAASDSVWLAVELKDSKGTAYFDSLQLEDGPIANRYNLMENGDFTLWDSVTWNPLYWTKNYGTDSGDYVAADSSHPNSLSIDAMKLNGAGSANKGVYQDIRISGNAGDAYVVGAWAKADSVPIKDSSRLFDIEVGFIRADGTAVWTPVAFNADSTDWHYVSGAAVAKEPYVSVQVYIDYYKNSNTAFFDGIQLYKEEFGTSFVYDSKGNLKTTQAVAEQKSTFEYNTNTDLIKTTSPKGYAFNYEFDNTDLTKKNHNPTKATSAENVVYSFTYDSYGNPLTSKVGDNTAFMQSSAAYSNSGNYISTLTDSEGNTAKYNYDETKGTLSSLTDAKGKTISYNYDANTDNLSSVSKSADSRTIANSYGYENDRIKSISHNGFNYSFDYDSLGNNTYASVGSQNLIENTYESKTSKLLESKYGNGQKVSSDYDDLGRIKNKKLGINGSTVYKYEYDASGNLGYHEDLENNVNYRYVYDLADRLAKIKDSYGNVIGFDYDLNSNLSKFTDTIQGKNYTTDFAYDKDNRQNTITYSRDNILNTKGYEYDSLGRVKSSTLSMGTNSFKTNYAYKDVLGGGTTTKVRELDNNSKKLSYTYDSNGNIDTITNEDRKVIKYYYNELNELVREDNGVIGKTITYLYDAGGNISSKTEYAYNNGTVVYDATTTANRNVYQDGGLEEGKNTITGKSTGTVLIASTGTIANLGPRTGSKYLYIDGSSSDNYAVLGSSIPVTMGKTYKITYYHKEATVGQMTGDKSSIKLSNGTEVNLGTTFTPDQIWRKSEMLWTCPSGVTSFELKFGFAANAFSWMAIDDVSVVEESKNNTFSDGSFEEGTTKVSGLTAKTALVGQAPNLPARSGVNSFFIDGDAGTNFALLGTTAPVIPGKTYSISFYHKEATAGAFTGNASSLWLGGDSYVDIGLSFTPDQIWRKKELIWTAPADTTTLQLRFGFYANAYSWLQIDDIEIVETTNYNPVKTYNYQYSDSNWKDKLTAYDGKAITYDAIGNPLTYNGYTYSWKMGRQLATISGNGLNVGYLYNDSGIRTQKNVGGVITRYHLVGDKVTYEDNDTDKLYYTYDSSNNLVSMNLNGVEYYYIRNAQGDIIGLFDKNGATVASYTYDSWGKLISIKDGSGADITNNTSAVGYKNPYRYRGYRYDTETGLYYLQSRYYNPEWGRFINADALGGQVGELLSHNVFAYCKNNPVNMEDPNGYWSIKSVFNKVSEVISSLFIIQAVRMQQTQNRIVSAIEEMGEKIINSLVSKPATKEVTKALPEAQWKATEFAEEMLENHYTKHVIKKAEWSQNGSLSQNAYLNRARNLLNSDIGGRIDGFTSKEGWVFKYNIQTNEFATGKPNGIIETLFRPKDGINYWNEQIKLFK
jgi:RHS repeat-associated protein